MAWDEFLAGGGGPVGHARGDGGQRAGVHPRDLRHDGQAEAGGPHPRRLPGAHPRHGPLGASACGPTTSGGRPPTSAGSSATATSSMRRCSPAAPRSRYEGALDYPNPDDVLAASSPSIGVTGVFTSPTAVRHADALRRRAPRASTTCRALERVFCAGEVLNPPAWEWLQNDGLRATASRSSTTCGRPRPAARSFGNPYGIDLLPIKPGSAGIPLPGHRRGGRRPRRRAAAAPGEKGIMVIKRPFPGLTADACGASRSATDATTGSGSRARYFTGDAAHIDEDGYVWFAGRADEIIKIAAHRIGTIEVETRLPAPPGRGRGRRHRPARRAARRGDRGVRRAEAGPRRRRTALRARAARHASGASSAPVAVIGELTSSTCCRRRAAARSCAASSRPSCSESTPATSRPSRTKARSRRPGTRWRNCAPRSRRPAESPIALVRRPPQPNRYRIATCDLACATIGFRR